MKSKTIVKNRIIDIDYEKNKISWFYYIPLLLIAGFVPLIVYGKYVNLNGTTQALFWTGQNELLDFFSYWKSRWVIFLTAIALIVYIFLIISKKLPFKKVYKYYIPLAIYSFFAILSTIFAIDVPTALNGFVDMYQGMWILLSYVTITFLVINYVNSERDVKLFLYAFIFLIIIEGIIGVGQYFGFDIFNTKLGNYLIIPSGVTVDGGLTFNFGKHTIYGTLFNTNFVGSFAALMMPMAVVFLISAKTVKKRVVAGVALGLCVFTWIGCNSRAGYIGVIFGAVVGSLVFRKNVLKHLRKSWWIFTVVLILIVILNFISQGRIFYQIQSLNVFKVLEQSKINKENAGHIIYDELTINNNKVILKSNVQNVIVKIDGDKLHFVNDRDQILPMVIGEDGNMYIDDPSQQYFSISINKYYPGFSINTPKWWACGSLNFYISEGDINMISSSGRLFKPFVFNTSEFFNNFSSAASGRVYIWSRSIPILKDNIFLGVGADNYIYSYPHNDILGRLNNNSDVNAVTDKPHNMYIQIAINTGLLSLLSLIVFWLNYIISSIKMYWKLKIDSVDKYIGIACFISVIGYLATGIFNDHIISVSPLFWIILGLGISINIRIKRKEENNA